MTVIVLMSDKSEASAHQRIAEEAWMRGLHMRDTEVEELRAEITRLRVDVDQLKIAVLAYDTAIQRVAERGKSWVNDNHLDVLYDAMLSAARRP